MNGAGNKRHGVKQEAASSRRRRKQQRERERKRGPVEERKVVMKWTNKTK
jgi:hypothetical protein